MSPISELFDIGGTPIQNAAAALIMLATAAKVSSGVIQPPAGLSDPRMHPVLAHAGEIVDSAIRNAETRGFTSTQEFNALITRGELTGRLGNLALDVIFFSGGPGRFFDLAGLALIDGAGGNA